MENTLSSDDQAPNAPTVAAMEEARTANLPSFGNVRDLIADLNGGD